MLSAPSPVVAVTTPPEAPAGVEAEVVKADEVRLSWSRADGATSYAVSVVAADGSETPATILAMGAERQRADAGVDQLRLPGPWRRR